MDEFLKMIGGLVLITGTLLYFLACIFAPFGIVWLVLNHQDPVVCTFLMKEVL